MADFSQDITVRSNFALAKKEFTSQVLHTFEKEVKLWPMISKESKKGLKESETIQPGRAPAAGYHEPGTELTDAADRTTQKITRFYEDRPTLWNVQRTDAEELTDHTNMRSRLPGEAGEQLAILCETEALKALAKGSATATSGDFDGGSQVTVSGATVAAAFPKTSAGAVILENALDDIIQGWEDDNVNTDGEDLYCFLSPYLMNVAKKHRDYFSSDYNGPDVANFANKKLAKLSRFWLVSTNMLPSSNTSAATQPTFKGTVQYGQDNTKLAFLAMKAGALSAWASPLESWILWSTIRQTHYIGAKFFKGITVERAHYCGGAVISGS